VEHLCYEATLRELGLFRLGRESYGDTFCGLPVPEGAYKKAGE